MYKTARREVSLVCHECDTPIDIARHTLEECATWGPQRYALVAIIGGDLSLTSVIRTMLNSEGCWSAMISFNEDVISLKEAVERQ